jgi:hypothetical protein
VLVLVDIFCEVWVIDGSILMVGVCTIYNRGEEFCQVLVFWL